MRIGIVTYWMSDDNYGQLLQCYALQKYLRLQGHDAFLIKYAPQQQRIKTCVKAFLRPIAYILSYLIWRSKYQTLRVAKQERALRTRNRQLNKTRCFDAFRETYIVSAEPVYHSIKELQANPPQADVYICGSDQIWYEVKGKNSHGWFLDFGKKSVKRIAYSCSAGGKIYDKEECTLFSDNLKIFDAISVREPSLKHICDSIGRTDAEIVADPTFLLAQESYLELAHTDYTKTHKSYMFLYILNVFSANEIDWPRIETYIREKKLCVSLVNGSGVCQARPLSSTYHIFYATISEWLIGIKNAECVLTTSFHGVVFSIIMQKPFLAMLSTNKFAKGNDRIISLLSELGLSHRIFSSDAPLREQMDKPIDWDAINTRVQSMRATAESFLRAHLS